MKTRIPAMTLALLATTAAHAALPQTGSGTEGGYTLVWQELFDAETLDPQRWNIEVNGDGGGNHELQYYTDRPENVRLGDDGSGNRCLILTARREAYNGKNFTSGRINSKNLTAFTHGKLEASIMLPKSADGLWPAFWMMGNDYDNVGWPRCGETDILEMGHSDGIRAGSQESYFNGACHWGQGWPAASYARSVTKAYSLQDGQYHLYTLIWDEDGISMYVDLDRYPVQNPYYRMDCPADDPDNEWSPGNYFHKDNFILFNLAVGGDFPGIHTPEGITALGPEEGSEASMYVNYVRIYQKGLASDRLVCADAGDPAGVAAPAPEPDSIAYDGSVITARSGELTLYATDGTAVAHSGSGSIATSGLQPGLYLASSREAARKVLVIR